jgi:predicted metal-dependent HD superfamily phosphohydrolase
VIGRPISTLIASDEVITLPRPLVEALLPRVTTAYAVGNRHYHTLGHAFDVLGRCAMAHRDVGLKDPTEVAIAALYHDAVYVAGATKGDNEEASLSLLNTHLDQAGISFPLHRLTIRDLILATAHHEQEPSQTILGGTGPRNVDYFMDADMAGFGASPAEFDRQNELIAREFAHVRPRDYLHGRLKFLAKLVSRRRLFRTDYFAEKYEEQAQANLARALKACL